MILLWAKTCDSFSDRMMDIVRGRASRSQSVKTLKHIGQCDQCRRDWEELHEALGLIAEIRDWGEIPARPEFRREVRRRVQQTSRRRAAVTSDRSVEAHPPRKPTALVFAAVFLSSVLAFGVATWWLLRPAKESAGGPWATVLAESFKGPDQPGGWRKIGTLEAAPRGRLEVTADPAGEYAGGGVMLARPVAFDAPTEFRVEVEVGSRGIEGGAAVFLSSDGEVAPTGRARGELAWWTEGSSQYLSSPRGEILWKSRGSVRPGEFLRLEMMLEGRSLVLRVNGREEYRGASGLDPSGGLYLGLRATSGSDGAAAEGRGAAADAGIVAAFGSVEVRRRAAR